MDSNLLVILSNELVFTVSLIAILTYFFDHRKKKISSSNKKIKYFYWIILAAISIMSLLVIKSRIIMVIDEYLNLFSYRTIYRFFTLKGGELFLSKASGWPLFLANLSLITGVLGYKQVFLVNGALYIFSVILFYELTKKITKDKTFAFIFAILYAINDSIIVWATSSENHTLSNFYLILGFIFLFDFFEKPSTKNITATLWTFAFSALVRAENFFVLTIVSIVVIVRIMSSNTRIKKRKLLIINLIAIFSLTSLEFLRIINLYKNMTLFGYETKKFLFSPSFFLKEVLHLSNPVSVCIILLFIVSIILLFTKKEMQSIPPILIFFTFLVPFYKANFVPSDLYRFNYPLILPMYLTIALASKHLLNKKSTKIPLSIFLLLLIILNYTIIIKSSNSYFGTQDYVNCITSINFTEEIKPDYLIITPLKFQYYFLDNEIIDYKQFRELYERAILPSNFLLLVDNNSWHIEELKEIVSEAMPLIKKLESEGKIKRINDISLKEGCNLNFYKST